MNNDIDIVIERLRDSSEDINSMIYNTKNLLNDVIAQINDFTIQRTELDEEITRLDNKVIELQNIIGKYRRMIYNNTCSIKVLSKIKEEKKMDNKKTIDMVISDLEDRIKSVDKSIALNEEGCKVAINEKNELVKNNAAPDKIEDVDKLISMYKDIIENRKKHKEGYLKDLEEWKKLKEEQENGRY